MRRQTKAPIVAAYEAAARMEKAIGILTTLNACMVHRLPLREAEDCLDDTPDHLDALHRKLTDAKDALSRHIDQLEAA